MCEGHAEYLMAKVLNYENTLTESSKAFCRKESRAIAQDQGKKTFEERVTSEMYTGQIP